MKKEKQQSQVTTEQRPRVTEGEPGTHPGSISAKGKRRAKALRQKSSGVFEKSKEARAGGPQWTRESKVVNEPEAAARA